jgi:hypothetical protein
MFSLILFEKDPFVRGDIADLVENSFADLLFVSMNSLSDFAEAIRASSAEKIAVLSGTCDELREFFSVQKPTRSTAFIVLNDSERLTLPADHSVIRIAKPFTSETFATALKTAIADLRSGH